MWVADKIDAKLYAYDMASRARVSAKEFNTLSGAGNHFPEGIWSDGTTMWVTDRHDNKIYAYDMASKARISAKEFNTLSGAGNNDSRGIASDGTAMWVSDRTDDKIYAYDAQGLVDTNSLSSLSMRVAEIAAAPDFIVSMSPGPSIVAISTTITLRATVGNTGGSSASTTLRWYRSTDRTITTADTLVGSNVLSSLRAGGRSTETISITAPSATNTYYYGACVDLVTNERYTNNNCSSAVSFEAIIPGIHLPTRDFTNLIAAENRAPRGIWSDGTTMWVADTDDDKLYAYNR